MFSEFLALVAACTATATAAAVGGVSRERGLRKTSSTNGQPLGKTLLLQRLAA